MIVSSYLSLLLDGQQVNGGNAPASSRPGSGLSTGKNRGDVDGGPRRKTTPPPPPPTTTTTAAAVTTTTAAAPLPAAVDVSTKASQLDFNMYDFLKMDTDLGLGSSGEAEELITCGSKASRWFGKTQPAPAVEAPVAPAAPVPEPVASVPGAAPLAPASTPSDAKSGHEDAARSLLEMLQKGTSLGGEPPKKGSFVTAEELERIAGRLPPSFLFPIGGSSSSFIDDRWALPDLVEGSYFYHDVTQ